MSVRYDLNYRVQVDVDNEITSRGKWLIHELLADNGIFSAHADMCGGFTDYRLKTREGKIAKRLASFLFKRYGVKIDSVLKGKIGSIANEHAIEPRRLEIEFSDDLDYPRGMFGDDNSCYWTFHINDRATLIGNECHMLRVYEHGHGIARAWIIPNEYTPFDGIMLYNGYGLETRELAMIVAEYVGADYRKVGLSVNNHSINNDAGYIIGDDNDLRRVHIDLPEYTAFEIGIDDGIECDLCGRAYDEDDGVYVDNMNICPHCYEYNERCEVCHTWVDNQAIAHLHGVGNVCTHCASDYEECPICEHHAEYSDMRDLCDDTRICKWCADEHTVPCDCGARRFWNRDCEHTTPHNWNMWEQTRMMVGVDNRFFLTDSNTVIIDPVRRNE